MGRIGITELLVVLIIVLIIFGPKQLPKLSRSLGETLRGFREGMQDETDEEQSVAKINVSTAETGDKASSSDVTDAKKDQA